MKKFRLWFVDFILPSGYIVRRKYNRKVKPVEIKKGES